MKRTNGNNFHRVIAATRVVYAYMENSGLVRPDSNHPTEQTWIDLLTDLRHFSATSRVDFNAAVRISAYHFDEESN